MARLAGTPICTLFGLHKRPMLKLSSKCIPVLRRMRESGMGYWVVTIVLKDGRKYPETVIDSGYVTLTRALKEIPFHDEDIEEIILTHDKWDWSREK